MNQWSTLRRLRGAIWLVLIGVLALLDQLHILRWYQSWPFFLIVGGLLGLAERAMWSRAVANGEIVPPVVYPQPPYMPYGATPYPAAAAPQQPVQSGTSIEPR